MECVPRQAQDSGPGGAAASRVRHAAWPARKRGAEQAEAGRVRSVPDAGLCFPSFF